MYLLDTNVVSELRKPRPHGGVVAWLAEVPEDSIHVSVVTFGELQAGVERTRRQDPGKAAAIEDAMIAATARVHRLTMVTRNERDFKLFDVPLLNPFESSRLFRPSR
jgi:predicted nucleic acid-binding protein